MVIFMFLEFIGLEVIVVFIFILLVGEGFKEGEVVVLLEVEFGFIVWE